MLHRAEDFTSPRNLLRDSTKSFVSSLQFHRTNHSGSVSEARDDTSEIGCDETNSRRSFNLYRTNHLSTLEAVSKPSCHRAIRTTSFSSQRQIPSHNHNQNVVQEELPYQDPFLSQKRFLLMLLPWSEYCTPLPKKDYVNEDGDEPLQVHDDSENSDLQHHHYHIHPFGNFICSINNMISIVDYLLITLQNHFNFFSSDKSIALPYRNCEYYSLNQGKKLGKTTTTTKKGTTPSNSTDILPDSAVLLDSAAKCHMILLIRMLVDSISLVFSDYSVHQV
jgi:hypothetical protein